MSSSPSGEFGQPGAVVVPGAAISARIIELAKDIKESCRPDQLPLVLIGVLKGSAFFTTDLGRVLTIPVEFDFVSVRSYGRSTESSGVVELVKDVSNPIAGRHVLMVEDIIDTGLTTDFLYTHIARHGPASLRLVTLLNKPARRQREVRIDFCGFDIPDQFVVGYGLDYAEQWRNLPDVRVLEGVVAS